MFRFLEIGAKPDRFRSKFDFGISWKSIFRSKNQIWFVKIELNFLGQHLAAVKRASNQIITEPTYKNFCNNLQVTSLKPWSNLHPLYYLSKVDLNMWQLCYDKQRIQSILLLAQNYSHSNNIFVITSAVFCLRTP